MTTDLWFLFASALLQWALIMTAATPQILSNGLAWAFGNRGDDAPAEKPAPWAARAERSSKNMQENLPMFAILVLVAHVSGSADALTANGSMVFFGGRVLYAIAYQAGIPYARTLLWAASIVGMGMIAYAIAT